MVTSSASCQYRVGCGRRERLNGANYAAIALSAAQAILTRTETALPPSERVVFEAASRSMRDPLAPARCHEIFESTAQLVPMDSLDAVLAAWPPSD